MAKCPNRNRKTTSAGGGRPGCRGVVEIVVSVPVVLTCKRLPKLTDGFKDLVKTSVQKHGVRVSPDAIRKQIDQERYDVQCPECGWSLQAAIKKCQHIRPRKKS